MRAALIATLSNDIRVVGRATAVPSEELDHKLVKNSENSNAHLHLGCPQECQ
jgi:hypothetical protein